MRKKEIIRLDCGLEATQTFLKKTEFLDVSLYGLYAGREEFTFDIAAKLFRELSDKGYENTGIEIQTGCYYSVNNIILSCIKTPKP